MKYQGGHIHQERTPENFNLAEGLHEGMTDYEFAKSRTHQEGIRRLNRDDVKDVCSWVVTMPRDMCHKSVSDDGEDFYEPNDQDECRDFFEYAYDFFKEKHGEANIISANVHMDENVPHMHFIFTPVVEDEKRGGLKVCAKEALHGCYGAQFQIELQDYISERMGREVHMVRQDTVDYERNVKELKKKGLNETCAALTREIARTEEELARKQAEIDCLAGAVKAAGQLTVKANSSRGYTVIKDEDYSMLLQQAKYITAMKEEQKQIKKILTKFESENRTAELQKIEKESEKLKKENKEMSKRLDRFDEFMEEAEDMYGFDLREDFERFEKEKNKEEYEMGVVNTWEK